MMQSVSPPPPMSRPPMPPSIPYNPQYQGSSPGSIATHNNNNSPEESSGKSLPPGAIGGIVFGVTAGIACMRMCCRLSNSSQSREDNNHTTTSSQRRASRSEVAPHSAPPPQRMRRQQTQTRLSRSTSTTGRGHAVELTAMSRRHVARPSVNQDIQAPRSSESLWAAAGTRQPHSMRGPEWAGRWSHPASTRAPGLHPSPIASELPSQHLTQAMTFTRREVFMRYHQEYSDYDDAAGIRETRPRRELDWHASHPHLHPRYYYASNQSWQDQNFHNNQQLQDYDFPATSRGRPALSRRQDEGFPAYDESRHGYWPAGQY